MDKRIILAVAGSGKTSYIIDSLSREKKALIITYTNGNYINLRKKILTKFNGIWPSDVTLMTYFSFLYHFCYKPYLSERIHARGIVYISNPNRYCKQNEMRYYLTNDKYFYSNRMALFFEKAKLINSIINRIQRFFDIFIIDEIQNFGGRDFCFLEQIMEANINMLFVGDFYQHTYDTSRDGATEKNLYVNISEYQSRFIKKGFVIDTTTLIKSWRCGKNICEYIRRNLGIAIESNKSEEVTDVFFVSDYQEKEEIINNPSIVKLHYQSSHKYGPTHMNWGETKGIDDYKDVCVMLNKSTANMHKQNNLISLPPLTKNKLYVAITRAHGNVFLVYE